MSEGLWICGYNTPKMRTWSRTEASAREIDPDAVEVVPAAECDALREQNRLLQEALGELVRAVETTNQAVPKRLGEALIRARQALREANR